MLKRIAEWRIPCLVVVISLLMLSGCDRQEPTASETADKAVEQAKSAETAEPAEQAEAAKEPAEEVVTQIDALLKVKLAAADQLDGTADKIVSKCASCALSMDGKKEHSLKVDEYTLYFCSEKCKSAFAENTIESIKSLKIPDMKLPKLP